MKIVNIKMNCREYIEHLQKFVGENPVHKFILDNSITFVDEKILQPNDKLKKLARYSYPKACFQNSRLIATKNKEWKYYEGYYICKTVPGLVLEHAWLVNDNGEVFDPTAINNNFEVIEYYGMEIPLNILKTNKNSIIDEENPILISENLY